MDIISFTGKFHPLLVHLPIGIIFIGIFLAVFINDQVPGKRNILAVTFLLAAFSGIVAWITGLMLSLDQRYDPTVSGWHKWMAVITVSLCILVWMSYQFSFIATKIRRQLFLCLVLALGITGHLGGTLTHGNNYFAELATAGQTHQAMPAEPDSVYVFTHLIKPVLNAKCINCHNSGDRRGGLDLSSYDSLMSGGDNGPVVVFGDASESEIFRRITLPPEHVRFMPPNAVPLSFEEILLVRWWIQAGGQDTARLSTVDVPEEVRTVLLSSYGMDTRKKAFYETLVLDSLPSGVFREASVVGWRMNYLGPDSHALEVKCARDSITREMLDFLLKYPQQITWLDVSASGLTDDYLKQLSRLVHLTKLEIQQNPLTDQGIESLSGLLHLEMLNLYGTGVTDSVISVLSDMKTLKSVYLWQTGMTVEGVEKLRNQRPDLVVNYGNALEVITAFNDKTD